MRTRLMEDLESRRFLSVSMQLGEHGLLRIRLSDGDNDKLLN
jgi:hypothetical protein